MSLPACTDADIQQHASVESIRRGREYWRTGAVASLVQRGTTLEADVWGSEPEPYQVRVTFAAGRPAEADCTCPYDWGGWCKHIVAALLAAREQPEEVEQRPPLAELLGGLDRDDLQALLLKLADHDPAVVPIIEAQAQLLARSPAQAGTRRPREAQRSAAPVDPATLRRQVRSLLGIGSGRRSWSAYGDVGGAVEALAGPVKDAQGLIEAGDGAGALAVLEVITEEFLAVWEELDDSSGESGDFLEGLGLQWAEALLTADLPAQERRAWASKLEAWQDELDDYGIEDAFSPAVAAARQGWDDPALQRILRGEAPRLPGRAEDRPLWDVALTEARLAVLDRQRRYEEYLRLAEAEGRLGRYVTMLARLGRGDAALAYARAHLTTTEQAFALASALWERGEAERALESAELGLTLDGPKAALASWLRDRAAEQGQPERARAAARIAFDELLSLDAYLKLEALAGPSWPDVRAELLDRLRAVRSYYSEGPVEIFLHENLIADAIALVDQGATHTLVERVAEAAAATHPDWVIAVSRQQAEEIMNAGKSQYYAAAARWLARARDAYRATGREQEWQTYLAGLLDRHRRKYSLVPLLKAL